jgi:hypothetical protein
MRIKIFIGEFFKRKEPLDMWLPDQILIYISGSLSLILKYLSFFLLFYYSYVHTRLGSFLPPAPTPSLTTHSAPFLSPPLPA